MKVTAQERRDQKMIEALVASVDQAFRQSTINKSQRAVLLLAIDENFRKLYPKFDHAQFMDRATNLPSHADEHGWQGEVCTSCHRTIVTWYDHAEDCRER